MQNRQPLHIIDIISAISCCELLDASSATSKYFVFQSSSRVVNQQLDLPSTEPKTIEGTRGEHYEQEPEIKAIAVNY